MISSKVKAKMFERNSDDHGLISQNSNNFMNNEGHENINCSKRFSLLVAFYSSFSFSVVTINVSPAYRRLVGFDHLL